MSCCGKWGSWDLIPGLSDTPSLALFAALAGHLVEKIYQVASRPCVAYPTLPVTLLARDVLSLFHFFKHFNLILATGPLYLLFPLPGKSFRPLSLLGLLLFIFLVCSGMAIIRPLIYSY